MEKTERRKLDRLLAQEGEPPTMAEELQDLKDQERDAWESLTAEDAVFTIIDWRKRSRRIYGTGPRQRTERTARRSVEEPEHWPGLWAAEMERFRPQQLEALSLVGRRHPDEPVSLEGLSTWDKFDVLRRRLRRNRRWAQEILEGGEGRFLRVGDIGPHLKRLATSYMATGDNTVFVINYPTESGAGDSLLSSTTRAARQPQELGG